MNSLANTNIYESHDSSYQLLLNNRLSGGFKMASSSVSKSRKVSGDLNDNMAQGGDGHKQSSEQGGFMIESIREEEKESQNSYESPRDFDHENRMSSVVSSTYEDYL